jgi:hypothetical protein
VLHEIEVPKNQVYLFFNNHKLYVRNWEDILSLDIYPDIEVKVPDERVDRVNEKLSKLRNSI